MHLDNVENVLQSVSLDIKEEAMRLLFTQQYGPSLEELVRCLHKTPSFETVLRILIRNAHGQGQHVPDKG